MKIDNKWIHSRLTWASWSIIKLKFLCLLTLQGSTPRVLRLGENPGCPCGGTHVSDISDIISMKVHIQYTQSQVDIFPFCCLHDSLYSPCRFSDHTDENKERNDQSFLHHCILIPVYKKTSQGNLSIRLLVKTMNS